MEDVIENCQTTFEEDGVNQQTLEDLRSVGRPGLHPRIFSMLSSFSLFHLLLLLLLLLLESYLSEISSSLHAFHHCLLCCVMAERISLGRFWREGGGFGHFRGEIRHFKDSLIPHSPRTKSSSLPERKNLACSFTRNSPSHR